MSEFQDKFKPRFREDVVSQIFRVQQMELGAAIADAIKQNNMIIKKSSPLVTFEGDTFGVNHAYPSWMEKAAPHPALEPLFRSLANQRDQLNDRKAVMHGYFTKGLNIAESFKDLYALFHEEMWEHFGPTVRLAAEKSKMTVTNLQVHQFRESTKDDINVYKQQLMTDLLNK